MEPKNDKPNGNGGCQINIGNTLQDNYKQAQSTKESDSDRQPQSKYEVGLAVCFRYFSFDLVEGIRTPADSCRALRVSGTL